MSITHVVGVGGRHGHVKGAEVVLPVGIVVDGEAEASGFTGQVSRRADEEVLAGGFDTSNQGAEGVAFKQVGLVGGGAGNLDAVGVGGPAVCVPGHTDQALRGEGSLRGGGEDNAGIEEFDLSAVLQGVDLHGAFHGFLPDGERADFRPGDGGLVAGAINDVETAFGECQALGGAVGEPDEGETAVERVCVAWHDAFEKAVEGAGFVLVGVFIGFQERGEDGDAEGSEFLYGLVAGGPVRALDGSDAGGDFGRFGICGRAAAVDRQDLREGNFADGFSCGGAFDNGAVRGANADPFGGSGEEGGEEEQGGEEATEHPVFISELEAKRA